MRNSRYPRNIPKSQCYLPAFHGYPRCRHQRSHRRASGFLTAKHRPRRETMNAITGSKTGARSNGLVLTAMIFAVAMTFIDQTIVSIAACYRADRVNLDGGESHATFRQQADRRCGRLGAAGRG